MSGVAPRVARFFWVLRLGLVWVTGFRCAGLVERVLMRS